MSNITTDLRSTVFSKSANPRDLPHKSTIRELFKAKSVDSKTYSPPSSWVPRCRRAFSSLFLWNFKLFYSFNWCKLPFSPVDSSLIHVQRQSTSLIYLVVSCPTHLIRFHHYGRNRRNRGWKWWLAEGEQKPDQPRCRSITGINHVVRVTQCSRRIKHLFFVSRKIILQNHASRLLWKSRFTWKKFAISRFTRKKGPITSHENTLYDPRKYTPSRLTIRIRTFVQSVIAAFFETFHFQLIVNLELTKLSRIA